MSQPFLFMNRRRQSKAPLPLGAVWWMALKRHPVFAALGRVVTRLRARRGWSLADLGKVSRIAKSHLCDLEHDRHTLSADMVLRLEAAFGMKRDGLMRLAWMELGRQQRRARRGVRY